ncbi:hypothetical protein [Alteromonas lipotrueae]|uniref:hypothetical protein n=1 Tax=Alteromonas lipotrueae TaxID=2803814 RepID=UPI001C451BB0|nr:hypothetical protein [Alteromonas lipotrueae]
MEYETELARKTEHIERELLFLYKSPVVTGDDLMKALGYKTSDAFRQAIARGTLPVNIFTIDKRRGRFALTADVAAWLAKESIKSEKKMKKRQ